MNPDNAGKTDEELSILVQNGEAEAFVILMDRYQGKITRYAKKFLSDEAHIEDAVQEIFLKTYENIQSFDSARNFSPWIYRIAHNTFVNVLRKNKREHMITLELDTLASFPEPEKEEPEVEREEMAKHLDHGLAQMSENYREVLILYYIENLGYQEIADVLRIPIGTVGIRLRRGKKILRDFLEKEKQKQGK